MSYDYRAKKIVAVINEELPVGKALNALGHLAFSAGHYSDSEWMGQATMEDADNNTHRGISRYPFIILKASIDEIKKLVNEARKKKIVLLDYPQEMFDTGIDDELVAAVSKLTNETAEYHAILLAGNMDDINTLTGHLKLYR